MAGETIKERMAAKFLDIFQDAESEATAMASVDYDGDSDRLTVDGTIKIGTFVDAWMKALAEFLTEGEA